MRLIRLSITLLSLLLAAGLAVANPVHLRCEFLENPLGIDATLPRLSWQSDDSGNDWKQSAYEILVATRPELLKAGSTDVWDSGEVKSGESAGIVYGGPAVQSRQRYYWSVRVWDAQGRASRYAPSAWWEMGLLAPSDWRARWIQWNNPENSADQSGMKWIWVAGQDALHVASGVSADFRLKFDVPKNIERAAVFLIARGDFSIAVNGRKVGGKERWTSFERQEITDALVVGNNVVEVAVKSRETGGGQQANPQPAGIAAVLKIMLADGTVLRIPTDGKWQSRERSDPDWKAAAVTAEWKDQRFAPVPDLLPQPAALLRREIQVAKEVDSARLYVTARGSYRFSINGARVGEDVLTPEYTDYHKRILYQTYDVTKQLRRGNNALAATLGDGWYGSPFTWEGSHSFNGPDSLIAQLEVKYRDGSAETYSTDDRWKAAPSAVLHSEIYSGETYDARLLQTDWDHPGFAAQNWAGAGLAAPPPSTASLRASTTASRAKVVMTLQPKSSSAEPDGSYVFDMGQNMVGWVSIRAHGPAGTAIRLRYAEVLNPDGTIYRDNLRNADATDRFVLRGQGTEEFTPQFTFHGFRYVEVSGYPGKPGLADLQGQVVSSLSGDGSGTLDTSSELINRMWRIGLWGQRGNFVTVPTDCPQRDERLGWMGDAGVFWRTGTYNFDVAAFSEKWIDDVTDAQSPAGAFSNVSPDMLISDGHVGAPGWGDAGVIVPYTTWLQYGDTRVIEEHWDAMQRWMDFIAKANPDFLRRNQLGPNYADWLAPDPGTPKDLISTAYWALIAKQMAEMAHAAGKAEEARRYAQLFEQIRSAYQTAYVRENGDVAGGTQTAYVLTLYVKLAAPALEPALTANLVKKIQERNNHLSTGFLGTPFLLFALADHGRSDVAYQLLLNESYPSWGYMLSKGATTWWERWNGDTGDPSMNSYNHYAFGSVVAWVYRRVAGIDTVPSAPGFHEIVFHPLLDDRVTHARGEYQSIYGKISSDWTGTKRGPFTWTVTVPANTTAQVVLPDFGTREVLQNGKPVAADGGATQVPIRLGSGTYKFTSK